MATIEKLSEAEKKEIEKDRYIEQYSTEEEREIYHKLKKILEHYRDNIFPEQFEIIKAKQLYSKEYEEAMKRLGLQNKSAKIYPLIAPIHDTFMTSLYDNDLRPKVFPLEDTDPKDAEMAQKFFSWGIELSETEQVNEIIRAEASLIGVSYGIPWYYTSQVKIDGESQRIFIPTLNYVSYFEVFHSIGARDFYKAPEKFRRRFIPFQDLEDIYAPLWNDMKENVENKREAILYHSNPLSKADFTKIYDIDSYSSTYLANLNGKSSADGIDYDNTFNVLDSSDYCEVVELYIRDQMYIMVNGYVVYSGESVYSYPWNQMLTREWPFIEITYEKGIGSRPRGIGHKIMPHQKQANAMFNSIGDAIYKHINPMYYVKNGAIYDTGGSTPTAINYTEGRTFLINQWFEDPIGKLDFTDHNVINIANAFLENIKQDAYAICGVNSYVMGGNGRVERSRYWTESRINASRARLNPMAKSIGRFYARLFYHWIWLSEKSSAKIAFISDWENNTTIDLSTLNKKLKIICSADTGIEEQRASKVQGLLTMMQNIAPLANNEITNINDINREELLQEIFKSVGLTGFKKASVEDKKKYLDESYEIKKYIIEKEAELQQPQGQGKPQQPTPEEQQPQPEERLPQQLPQYSFPE